MAASNITQNTWKGHRPGRNDNQWLFLGLQPGTEAWRGCHSTHTHPAAWQNATARDEGSEWGGEGKESISQKVCSHFPETQCHQQKSLKAGFSFGCTSETGPWPAAWVLFWLYFRNRALTCSLVEDLKLSQSVWHLGTPSHSLGSCFPPSALVEWRCELHSWYSEAQGAMNSFPLCFSWQTKSPQNF